ncbi:ABC transporter ATP-binding protein [Tannockella kyphosi]|uniref:ABC transporter ATP-binding protein n=1 Tax=Tannockella kyphosi TaxID=2899121 RepID=UPI002011783F|nr:ABC transporter ATP-binding protein [Tannockella kyphosi]
MELEIRGVSKQYHNKLALCNFSIVMEEGIYALLGPNGAGKSTLMNILAGCLDKTNGEILIDGQDLEKRLFKNIAYMPQHQQLYEDFTGQELMEYFSLLKGMNKKEASKEIERYLKDVGLYEQKDMLIKAYSGGMKQRILFAATLLNNPKILILDEVTAGMDPMQRLQILNILSMFSKDKIILFASHVLSDIEMIATHFIFLKEGKIIVEDTMDGILQNFDKYVYEKEINFQEADFFQKKHLCTRVKKVSNQTCLVRFLSDIPKENYPLKDVELEDVYVSYFFEEIQDVSL